MRTWQVDRRKRTRHLIELGGLVVKARIVELTGDDRATILGALLWMADKLQSDQANGRVNYGPQRGSKRSRRTQQHTRGQIELLQQFVVDAQQWHVGRRGCVRGASFKHAGSILRQRRAVPGGGRRASLHRSRRWHRSRQLVEI